MLEGYHHDLWPSPIANRPVRINRVIVRRKTGQTSSVSYTITNTKKNKRHKNLFPAGGSSPFHRRQSVQFLLLAIVRFRPKSIHSISWYGSSNISVVLCASSTEGGSRRQRLVFISVGLYTFPTVLHERARTHTRNTWFARLSPQFWIRLPYAIATWNPWDAHDVQVQGFPG